jgi:hypothetical protein
MFFDQGEGGRELATTPVEQRDRVACSEPKYAYVPCNPLRQLAQSADFEWVIKVKARHGGWCF